MTAPARKLNFVHQRSPERDKLHGYIERDRVTRETVEAAKKNFDRAKDRHEHAQSAAKAAQAKLQALDAEEAKLIAQSWPPRALTAEEKQKRRDTEEVLAHAVRVLKTVEADAQIARAVYDEELAKLAPIGKEIDATIAGILVEESKHALKHLLESRRLTVKAEEAVRSIAAALVAKSHFAEAEKIGRALVELPRPEGTINAVPYLDLMAKLRGNADAEIAQ
jgi:hypothetical protein